MRFAIFTHVLHSTQAGEFFAYPPYVREMNLWLRQVDEVEVIAPAPQPLKKEKNTETSYLHLNIKFTKIPYFNLLSLTEILKSAFKIPYIFLKIFKAMSRADHLHLRCPGNVGLLACICQIFFPGKPKSAKYAGNWDPEAKQPWTYKLQRWILGNTFLTRNMQVLVYGNWPGQSKNILSFFTASFFKSEREKTEKNFCPPYKFLFVGNLVPGKQPLIAVQLVKALKEKNINAELHVYGDGPLKDELMIKAQNLDYIHLHKNQPLDVLKRAYKEAHFLILASRSEGWPKAVAEGMFFGCIPVASAVSCVPWMLDYGKRGILIPDVEKRAERREKRGEREVDRGQRAEDRREVKSGEWKMGSQHLLEGTVEKINELIRDPKEMKKMSMEAQEWSQQYTLERFEEAIKEVLFSEDVRP